MEARNTGQIAPEDLSPEEQEKHEQLTKTHTLIINTMKEEKVDGISIIVSDLGSKTSTRVYCSVTSQSSMQGVIEGIAGIMCDHPILMIGIMMEMRKRGAGL
jgi:hypothetical protein